MIERNKVNARVVSSENIVFKKVPGFSNLLANSNGEVFEKTRDGKIVLLKTMESGTSVGSYFVTPVKDDDGKNKIPGIHQLVCLAFHGEKPSSDSQYDVNHIDGNKHNNKPDNLEWVTHSENMLHALQNGLRNDNIKVTAKNVKDGTVREFYSIIEFSRAWGTSRHLAKNLISGHRFEPYQGTWIFELDFSRLGVIKRPHHAPVMAKDYVRGITIIANNCNDLQYHTGVGANTIKKRLNRLRETDRRDEIFAGYVFRYLDVKDPFPEYSKDFAIASREKYFSKKCVSLYTTRNNS